MSTVVRCACRQTLAALPAAVVLLLVAVLETGCMPASGQRQGSLEPQSSDGPANVPQAKTSSSVAVEGAKDPPVADAVSRKQPEVFAIGPGIYELTAPGAELLDETERSSTAGITITGGARLPSLEVTASQARQQVEDIKRGNVAPLGDVVVSWSLIIYATPKDPGPVKNPQARPIVVSGLSGIEIRGERDITWAFPFADHTLMISARGPADRLDSSQVQTILHSLRRAGPIPDELASRAKSTSGQ